MTDVPDVENATHAMEVTVDAHQHFWQLSRGDYDWLTPDLAPLYRDYLPADLAPLMRAGRVRSTVAVQAAPTVEETRFLLALADETPWIAGVVGWVDFEARDVAETLSELAAHPKLVGLRPMIQDIADPDWMLGESLAPAFAALVANDLCFDALIRPLHLSNLRRLLDRHPELRVVVCHGAKPDIAAGELDGWARELAAIARETTAVCKLSGLATEAGADWTAASLRPYVDHLLGHFGAKRLMWGSDWPVVELAGGHALWLHTTRALLADLPEADRREVFGDVAARVYRLEANGL